MDKPYVVFNYEIANRLIESGYSLRKIEPSRSNRHKLVFVFNDRDRVIEYLDTLQGGK